MCACASRPWCRVEEQSGLVRGHPESAHREERGQEGASYPREDPAGVLAQDRVDLGLEAEVWGRRGLVGKWGKEGGGTIRDWGGWSHDQTPARYCDDDQNASLLKVS